VSPIVPEGRTLVTGHAVGSAIVLARPLSFWGGLDPGTGELIDTHHPQLGANIAGCILVMPTGRGSSSSSYVLAEAIRAGTAPAGIILREPDGIVALGAIVARELYGIRTPVIVLDADAYDTLDDDALGSSAIIEVDARDDGATVRLAG
jgi:predicted aconitase with swiveling domain